MSELSRKLKRLTEGRETRARAVEPVVERVFSRAVDPRLFALSPDALRRMGFEGAFDPETCAFLDTETTGLSGGAGTVAFLVGIGRVRDGVFTVTQYLMPDYPAESELLQKVEACLAGADTYVTFNGKTFDVPLLQSRRVMCRMRPLPDARQIDLLHPARRVWKIRLESCRLSNLEARILGAPREGDLPGSEVPERYFTYLKTRDFALLEDVIDHNRQDILTLETLLIELCARYRAPREVAEQLDVFSLGKVMEKQGDAEEAVACYQRAAKPPAATSVAALAGKRYAQEALFRLSRLHLRGGEVGEAENALTRLAQGNVWRARAYVELAKICEHRKRDLDAAIDYARRALGATEDLGERAEIEKRVARLEKRIRSREAK